MIVWLIEAIKNLHPCIVLNSIYLSYAFYCEVDPYYLCWNIPLEVNSNILIVFDNWQPCMRLNLWIIFILDCFLFPYIISKKSLLLPRVFRVPLKNLLINSLDSHQVFVLEDKPFPYGTLCHCEKCRGFGLYVWTLLFWEFAISFLLTCFICLNEINLWECLLYFILYAQWFLLSSFVELCWTNLLRFAS